MIKIIWIGSIVISCALTWYMTHNYYTRPVPNNNDIPVTPVVSEVIQRDTEKITLQEAIGIIHCYDTSEIKINWDVLEQTKKEMLVRITGNICERSFMQEASLPIVQTSSGNWKIALGFGFGALATAGAIYGGYRLVKLFN